MKTIVPTYADPQRAREGGLKGGHTQRLRAVERRIAAIPHVSDEQRDLLHAAVDTIPPEEAGRAAARSLPPLTDEKVAQVADLLA